MNYEEIENLGVFRPVVQENREAGEGAVEFPAFGSARRMNQNLPGGCEIQPAALVAFLQRLLTRLLVLDSGLVLLFLAFFFRFRFQGDRQTRNQLRPQAFAAQIPHVQLRAQFIDLFTMTTFFLT